MSEHVITFHKEYDCAIFPQRGTEASAGFDFFVPKPTSVNSNAFDQLKAKINNFSEDIFGPNDTPELMFLRLLFMWNKQEGRVNRSYLYVHPDKPSIWLYPGENLLIPSGISADIPKGYVLDARNKSGVASKKSLIAGAELVDEDYTGIIHIDMHNIGTKEQEITCGMKIVQFMLEESHIYEVEQVNSEEPISKVTERGAGGFGSTGTQV